MIEILPEQKKIELPPKEPAKDIKTTCRICVDTLVLDKSVLIEENFEVKVPLLAKNIAEKRLTATPPATKTLTKQDKLQEKDAKGSQDASNLELSNKIIVQKRESKSSKPPVLESDAIEATDLCMQKVSNHSPQSKIIEIPVSHVTLPQSSTDTKKHLAANIPLNKEIQVTQTSTNFKPSRSLVQPTGPVYSDDQKKKKEKLSIIEDMKLEFHGDELHIINNLNEDIDIPLDSLKVSTIHDISKNIQDKLHLDVLDHDELLLLESKLGKIY